MFSLYFWNSEGWTPRNEVLLEAIVKQAKVTRHPLLVECDANMCPEDLERSLWFQRETDACCSSERSVHMQIQRFERRVN